MKDIMKKYRKAKGFTLIELLIVIIIIGILAGMMMLSIGSATDKAQAAKIVSNLRNLKAAVVMYYADYDVWPAAATFNAAGTADTGVAASLDKYLDRGPGSGYSTTSSDTEGVNAVFDSATVTAGIRDKLKATAANSGLYSVASGDTVYSGSGKAYMRITK